MMQPIRELLLFLLLAIVSKATGRKPPYSRSTSDPQESVSYCLSWRLAVEANNVRAWRVVPTQCLRYIETYMIGGQYDRDVELMVDQILSYANEIVLSDSGMDAWILDVDDTCISNVFYYKGKWYRSETDGGKTAVAYKSGIRKQLMEEGYRIWGNVGGQWSDLQGDCVGNCTFKIPNPMYFVPRIYINSNPSKLEL